VNRVSTTSIPAATSSSRLTQTFPVSALPSPRKTAPSSAPLLTRASSPVLATLTLIEILHAAQLSPIALTHKLTNEDWEHLFVATLSTLTLWTKRLTAEAGKEFPEKVTAFRPDMAVHGRYGQPCPRCRQPIQRIRYADNETNYCAQCQTGGKVLADRSLSRLLGKDWPRTLDELEALKRK
jgi:hypothetical protein